jgi:preprotein translocase SecE subunit
MGKYEKYVNGLFVLAGAITWLVSRHYAIVAVGYFQLARKIGPGADVLIHVLPFIIGIATFLILRRTQTTLNFTEEAVGELVKVSWPTTKEVRLGTIVVIITVLAAGVVLGVIDIAFTALIRTILNT